MCAAFVLRAIDSIRNDGRVCFILPVSLFSASTSQEFVKELCSHFQIETIINFGDIRKLLFDEAKQPTLVMVGSKISDKKKRLPESFEYWVPKADISLSFGRLALHGTDRHTLSASAISYDNSILTTLFWGNESDLGLITRLKVEGTLNDLFENNGDWRTAKGFHRHDASQKPVSSKALREMHFLDAKRFSLNGPVLDSLSLEKFPEDIKTVARLPQTLLEMFEGPRIVFTDGLTSEREIRAAYSSKSFSFTSSIGVISSKKKHDDLLRFIAVFLHSDIVRYFIVMTAYQVNFERERISLQDIKNLPFINPVRHRNPQEAKRIIKQIADFTREIEKSHHLEQEHIYNAWKPEAERCLSAYFGLSRNEVARIKEVVEYILPSMQPSTYSALHTPLQKRPNQDEIESYGRELVNELSEWRRVLRGKGEFALSHIAGAQGDYGQLGIAHININTKDNDSKESISEQDSILAVLDFLKNKKVLPLDINDNFYLIADYVIRHNNSLYLIKPLVRRLWLRGEAYQDARRIVNFIQGRPN
jgi:hypothetical protein